MANATKAQIGSQITVDYAVGSPITWTSINPIRSVSGLGLKRGETDSTTLDSLAVERIGALPDGQEFTLVCTTAASNIDQLEDFVISGAPIQLRVTFPSPLTKVRYFYIVPLGFDHGTLTPSGLVEITINGRITGAVSRTALA